MEELKKLKFNLTYNGSSYLRELIEIINSCRNQYNYFNNYDNICWINNIKKQKRE